MMQTKELSAVLAAAPSFSDMAGKNVLMKDSLGNLGVSGISSLLPVRAGSAVSFANVLPYGGLYLCAVYSESNRYVNCVFTVLYVLQSAVDNNSPFSIISSKGGLTVLGANAFGSIAMKMTDGTPIPSDLRLLYIGVKF